MKYYIVDFDGTITLKDTLVEVFDKYCVKDWLVPENRMFNGEISRTQALFEEVDLMKVTEKELWDFISKNIKIRNGFSEFVGRVHKHGDKMMILSGGFRSFVEFILGKEGSGVSWIGLIIANNIKYLGDGRWKFIPCPDTLPQLCGTCPNCKRAMVEKIICEGYETVYIGDGETDFCASEHASEIWATGSLAQRLDKKGVKYHPFDDFGQIK
ncbi:MAG TPA: MtnX-like HAD-IB family phosphatase [bacterium]|nr:MtnX-like HAD-IB family phosphatase [bacterium]